MNTQQSVWSAASGWLVGRWRLALICFLLLMIPSIVEAFIWSSRIGLVNYMSIDKVAKFYLFAQAIGVIWISIIQLYVIISVHWALIRNERFSYSVGGLKPFWSYFWRMTLLALICGFISGFFHGVADFIWGDWSAGLTMVPAIGILLIISLSKWGTWLPASVVGGNSLFAASKYRGVRTFSDTLLQLVIYNVPLIAAGIFYSYWIKIHFGNAFYFIIYLQNHEILHAISIFLNASVYLIFPVIGAALLSRAYIMSEEMHPIPSNWVNNRQNAT